MSRRPLRTLLAATALAAGLIGGPQIVKAAGVSEAEQSLEAAQDALDNLVDQMGQLDEDYGAAQDRKAALDEEIAVSQTKVDQMSTELGAVQQVLQDLAVTRFTSGGSSALSPLFSDASTYSAAEQKAALGRVALDTGEATADDLQLLVDQLNDEQANLQRKLDEAAQLVTTLEQKQAEFEQLQVAYEEKLAAAEAAYGKAQVEAEMARREAAADAAAAAAAAANQPAPATGGNTGGGATSPGRGGGGNTGGGGSGGSTTPPPTTPKPTAPPVSGKAGVAVSAAYSQLGVPYRFAAEEPGVAFDCSGLTKWAWGRAGVYLPHQSRAQYGAVPHVSKDQAQPGDLIFYYSPIGHVGIYVGNGMMVHAPQTGKTVSLVPVRWGKVVGVGRPG
ncbi:MAG: hypothetical protein RL238_1386 [Actinomycetota bacterium]|jgi:cell wall-associated NlpC family hydrolase